MHYSDAMNLGKVSIFIQHTHIVTHGVYYCDATNPGHLVSNILYYPSGVYYFDATNPGHLISNINTATSIALIQTSI